MQRRQVMMEALRALVVLALLMLSFGHQPLAREFASSAFLAGPGGTIGNSFAFCGDGPDSGDHAPCHACRLGVGAPLPAPPGIALPAYADIAPIRYAPLRQPLAVEAKLGPIMQTGPPIS